MGPGIDLQLAVYAHALLVLGKQSPSIADATIREVAYVHASKARDTVRDFSGDALTDLLQASLDWLAVATTLVESGTFPRTVDSRDCRFCPFLTYCGDGAQKQSADKLSAAELPAGALAYGQFREVTRHWQSHADDATF